MNYSFFALAFSILPFGLLFLSGIYKFEKMILNITPYISLALAGAFYAVDEDGLQVKFLVFMFLVVALLHVLLVRNEKK